MEGRTYFPVTINGSFGAKCELRVTPEPIASSDAYTCVGIHKQFFYPRAFSKNSDATNSIISSYTAAVQAGRLKNTVPTFLTLDPNDIKAIGGSSEGIATLLAMLGCQMDAASMITGFVDAVGMVSHDDLMSLTIKPIDCVKAKAIGAAKCNLTLFCPAQNLNEFNGVVPSCVVGVATVSDALAEIAKRKF